jgi:formylglycine-generating enzyme required for sulfatase activity
MKKSILLSLITLALVLASCSDPNSETPDPIIPDPVIPAFTMILVPATPAGGFQRDGTVTNMTAITQSYQMAATEVTQELFQAVMGTNPSYFTSGAATGETQAKRPVENVSWYGAIAFCNKLSLKDGKTPVYSVSGVSDWAALANSDIPTVDNAAWNAATMNTSANGYRLPTEMQWMWAAMGATSGGDTVATTGYTKAFAGSNGSNAIDNYAWCDPNSDDKTHEVGKKTANELGLYDMSGNVWEWCWDWWNNDTNDYEPGSLTNPTGTAVGTERVVRGGRWVSNMSVCTVAYRDHFGPTEYPYGSPGDYNSFLGFRFVCP